MKKILTFLIILFQMQLTYAVSCNWKSKVNDFSIWTNCDSTRTNTYLIGRFILNSNYTCSKGKVQKWMLSSSNSNTLLSSSQNLYYKITQNGTYNVCLVLYDSCNRCDTMICKSVTVNCIPTGCNWKSKINDFNVWTNCDSTRNNTYLIGQFAFNSNYTCSKTKVWKWGIGTGGNSNTITSYSKNLYYKITQNGTYNVCLYLYDSCNKCDTMICKSVTVSCIPGCNWKSKVNDFNIWTNCDSSRSNTYLIGRFILNKNYTCTKGKRWKWIVNNSVVSESQNLYYKLSKNGTYNACLYLYDSCNKCDTMICKSVTVNCIPEGCNWKSKINDFNIWTNCDSARTNTYLVGRFILNKNYTCTKGKVWKWVMSNGTNSLTTISYGQNLYYNVKQNGTYNICLYLYDSCNNCDTMLCKSVTVACIPGCNWKSKVNDFNIWTNCDSTRSNTYLIGRFILNKNYTCTKGKRWKWMVNNRVVSESQNLYYKLTENGTYNACLYLYDSCNKCDTVFCKTVTVNCLPSSCNWKSKVNDFNIWTNCDSTRSNTYLIGRFILNKNYTCTKGKRWKWMVNNTVVSQSQNLYYKLAQNGNYTACLYLYDSCNKCDTVFCKTVSVNCISKCNWSSKIGVFDVKSNCDSNKNTVQLIGLFGLKQGTGCSKPLYRKWLVNNVVAGYGERLYYTVKSNGLYKVCIVVYDSCNKCDTSLCKIIPLYCKKLSIEGSGRLDDVKVYPNPVSGILRIQGIENTNGVNFTLIDINGKSLELRNLNVDENGEVSMVLSEFAPGVYTLLISEGTLNRYIRIVIE